MIPIIKDYLAHILIEYEDLALDYENTLKNNECDGQWRNDTKCRLKEAKSEITKLHKCLKFLKAAERD